MNSLQQTRNTINKEQIFALMPHNTKVFSLALYALLLLSGCYEMGTRYAPGYSEDGFDSITIGDSKKHLVAVLGEPLRIVGHLFTYRYLEQGVNFTVNSETGDVSVSAVLKGQSGSTPPPYSHLTTLDQLTKSLGAPDKILRAHSGQSYDPDLLSYIYSDEAGQWWKLRVVFVHKVTGKVADKWASNMTD